MDDPRTILLDNLALDKMRVVRSGSPIVLLCGGKVSDIHSRGSPSLSLRDILVHTDTPFELFRPEEIQSWNEDAIFRNLVEFEKALAGITTLIVIILESAGSIAELGAFSQVEELAKKLVVFVSNNEGSPESFISLGILRHLTEKKPESVKRYPWEIKRIIPDSQNSQLGSGGVIKDMAKGLSRFGILKHKKKEKPSGPKRSPTENQKNSSDSLIPKFVAKNVLEDMVKDISDELSRVDKLENLDSRSMSHLFVVTYELISIFIALKESEIISYLNKFGFSVSKPTIRKVLFLMKRFQLVVEQEMSDAKFFLINEKSDYSRLQWSLKSPHKFERLRFGADCRNYYSKTDTQRHRKAAIQESGKGEML